MFRSRLLACLLLIGMGACSTQPNPNPPPTPANTPAAAPAAPIRILRLDSYHDGYMWSTEIHRGVVDGLKDHGYAVDGQNITLEDRYLDTKRNTSPEYFARIGAETIAYIRATKPDLVIVSDDNATRLVVQPMRLDGIRFVILGLNGKPEDFELTTSPYVAAVLERPHIQEFMGWIEQVFGENARVTMLAEDSATSAGLFGDNKVEKAAEKTTVKLVNMTFTNNYAEWQKIVLAAPQTSAILFLGSYSTLRRADGSAVEPTECLRWTLANSPIPVLNFWEEAAHVGALGGPVISGYTQGYEAAARAARILDGTPINAIGFSAPPRGKLIVNRNAMNHWGVQIPLDLLEVSEIVVE
ncbi:MAG TPA: ABC transporter substrate binding protein [Phototrophicaceae bacterium]|nr:ABC transporter substrate binding protein [Phototrophicaceae bacterium]